MASMLKSVNPVTTKAWQELVESAAMDGALSIKELFVEDPDRVERFPGHLRIYMLTFLSLILQKRILKV
ncbi:MAG TPA: hypothetical protein PKE52_02170 [Bacteroidales bacterium]|nr:hypothetical protein [Bacteroidales bacterium]